MLILLPQDTFQNGQGETVASKQTRQMSSELYLFKMNEDNDVS